MGFRHSPPKNYFDGVFNMTVAAEASYSYCMTARSASGMYFAIGSSTGWLSRNAPIDPSTCL